MPKYTTLCNTTSKLHNSTSSIGFIKKAFHHKVIQKFCEINDQVVNKEGQTDAEQQLMSIKEMPIKYIIS